ncbi:DUF4232 domain-containing protein [Saccharopolyspora rhizosphaerae]|uniref:DUF4232 domain-containing protein n=1 Tax=Saccharopolyspora rhizosphaerae TaxID=2492662 RepID=A0A426JHX9_9PSEU|nr:DUF4232 domain-containing protein [Saccharopolyspora rhizosphaerae]RRO12753.1 DUF4232 domain-containing protein [Saccharopolyspora rhizosphaerae]
MLKRIGTATALLGGTLLITGCSGQAAALTHAVGTAPADEISASQCAATDFRIELQAQPDPSRYLLTTTNTSDQACRLGGWVALTPKDMTDEPIEQVPSTNVEVPGAPQDLTLAPGRTAFAGVHVELGDKQDSDTYVTSGVDASPTDMSGSVNAPVRGLTPEPVTEIPLRGLQVGTLQPSAQGVLF